MKTIGPNVFIVGAAKAGTSALANFLGQHPQIFVSQVKEPYFFISNPEISVDEYFRLFSGAAEYQLRVEATTGYLFDHESPFLIKQYCPDAKIIIVLRRPEDMAFSLWRYMCTNGNETEMFMKAISDRAHRQTQTFIASCAGRPENYLYLDRVEYSDQVERYLALFGRRNVKVVIYERFRRDQVNVVQDIYNFLGVDAVFVPEIREINVSGATRSLLLHWVTHKRYPTLKKIIPLVVRKKIRESLKLFNTNTRVVSRIDSKDAALLRGLLKGDVQRTRALINDEIPELDV